MMGTESMRPNTSTLLPLAHYDRVLVMFSGGKDSTAALLHLLEQGVPKNKIRLWHHAVDGAGERFMDWPVTESYCRAVAEALGVELRFSWRDGGFLREMLRDGTPTAPVEFETEAGSRASTGGNGPGGTRLKFPQVSGDLRVRWCSAYLKIDVARRVLSRDPAYARGRFLVVTGERREESRNGKGRALYAEVEKHASSNQRRRVDQWRPILDWPEREVWAAMERWRVRPHPAYGLGWGRVSCALCIFGQANQWASARDLMPEQFRKVADMESRLGVTIHRQRSVDELADRGKSYVPADAPERELAMAESYTLPVILRDDEEWTMPPGAFKATGGPN